MPDSWQTVDTITPALYSGKIIDTIPVRNAIDTIYYPNKWYFMTNPIGIGGASGSPIFFKCTLYNKKNKPLKQWVEFAGSQSGKNSRDSCAYMVKGSYLRVRINPPPRKK